MLRIDKNWRYRSPGEAPKEVRFAFDDLIHKIANQGHRKAILEVFKSYFAGASGSTSSSSSDEGWAASDLIKYMEYAEPNEALFIAAFYDACEEISRTSPDIHLPDIDFLNGILAQHKSRFTIVPPDLVQANSAISVEVVLPTLSFDDRVKQVIQKSLDTAQSLLEEGKNRQAVSEALWLLESIINGFQGLEVGDEAIKGNYFKPIVGNLKQVNAKTSLPQIIRWVETLHGYLSSPTGGGIRHGRDLVGGLEMSSSEARLYYNLTRSYVSYLMDEYARLRNGNISAT